MEFDSKQARDLREATKEIVASLEDWDIDEPEPHRVVSTVAAVVVGAVAGTVFARWGDPGGDVIRKSGKYNLINRR